MMKSASSCGVCPGLHACCLCKPEVRNLVYYQRGTTTLRCHQPRSFNLVTSAEREALLRPKMNWFLVGSVLVVETEKNRNQLKESHKQTFNSDIIWLGFFSSKGSQEAFLYVFLNPWPSLPFFILMWNSEGTAISFRIWMTGTTKTNTGTFKRLRTRSPPRRLSSFHSTEHVKVRRVKPVSLSGELVPSCGRTNRQPCCLKICQLFDNWTTQTVQL